MTKRLVLVLLTIATAACRVSAPEEAPASSQSRYFDRAGRTDILSGGVRLIPITTPKGVFRVWTKRVGFNPKIKLLLLHGGPGMTHEYFEAADSYLPGAGVEYYYYDQLGSAYSDQPKDTSLWDLPRFVEEVEQVRQALGLGRDNFYLLGHAWGGILATEYALKYQQHLKGLIVSNMMMSASSYNEYTRKVLMPKKDQKALEQDTQHILRMPADQWPDPVNRALSRMNKQIYVAMRGPSEMGLGGTLAKWDRTADLGQITVPTLVIGATHDTMDPKHMEWVSKQVKNGQYLHCPNGSHLSMYDDQETYFGGLIRFLTSTSGSAGK